MQGHSKIVTIQRIINSLLAVPNCIWGTEYITSGRKLPYFKLYLSPFVSLRGKHEIAFCKKRCSIKEMSRLWKLVQLPSPSFIPLPRRTMETWCYFKWWLLSGDKHRGALWACRSADHCKSVYGSNSSLVNLELCCFYGEGWLSLDHK